MSKTELPVNDRLMRMQYEMALKILQGLQPQ